MKIESKIRDFLELGVIIGALPNNIVDGQVIDAVPVMADLNFIVSQVNANAASASDIAIAIASLGVRNTFSPTVAFGGASVGLTYGANGQTGYWCALGNLCWIFGSVRVSAKGSSTGAMTIEGLPKTSANVPWIAFGANADGFYVPINVQGLTIPPSVTGTIPVGVIAPHTTTMSIQVVTSNSGNGAFNQLDAPGGFAITFAGVYSF